MGKEHELVMGVPTSELFTDIGFYFNGFMPAGKVTDYLLEIIRKKASFRYRGTCETDPGFKQIIPYCIITAGERVFIYQRKTGSEEARLHSKNSIGVGGHINPPPAPGTIPSIINQSMLRELAEEVSINGSDLKTTEHFRFAGVINWDQDDVGKVHLGLVYEIALPGQSKVMVKEEDKLEGELLPIKWLPRYPADRWETWSRLVVDDYLCFP